MRPDHFFPKLGVALAMLTASASASASVLELEGRVDTRRSGTDSFQQSIFYQTDGSWISARAGARLGISSRDLDSVASMGEISLKPLPWIEGAVRVSHANRFDDGTAATTIFTRFALEPELLFGFGWTASIGYYWRINQVSRTTIVPTFTNVSFVDRDLATTFGFFLRTDTWRMIARIGSWEAIDVYRLNHPYAEGVFDYHPWNVFAIVRSQLLLGFGRLDGWILAAGVKWDMGS